MIDGVELNVNDYVEVQNFNQPTVEYVDSQADLTQSLTVDIVSKEILSSSFTSRLQ
jgi:hypothetical protein